MLALINRILDWFKSLFWKEEMELTLVGLQYSGKTTFVNVIAVRESWISFICYSLARVVLVSVGVDVEARERTLGVSQVATHVLVRFDNPFEVTPSLLTYIVSVYALTSNDLTYDYPIRNGN